MTLSGILLLCAAAACFKIGAFRKPGVYMVRSGGNGLFMSNQGPPLDFVMGTASPPASYIRFADNPKYVLDRSGGGTELIYWEFHGGENQRFTLAKAAGGGFYIHSQRGCIEVRDDGSMAAKECADIDRQKFELHGRGSHSESRRQRDPSTHHHGHGGRGDGDFLLHRSSTLPHKSPHHHHG
jgi:hypothetical protein